MSQIEIEEDYNWQIPVFTKDTNNQLEYLYEYLYGSLFFFSFLFCLHLLRSLKGKS
jgi:hypothetical protein